MKKWPHEVGYWSMDDILTAVDNVKWQAFRKSLKGISTEEKLIRLDEWLCARQSISEKVLTQCRVDNYINALKRGGQLNMQLEVVR